MIENILSKMLTMEWATLDSVNTSAGMHTIFTYTAGVVPIFIPLVLFAFFTIACIGSYYASIRLNNTGDFPASFAAAGFLTAILAVTMSLIPGLINLLTLVVTFGVAILGVLWLFFSKNR